MESVESPLDVLSRAASMVQDSLPSANTVADEESGKQASTKQLPTTKWKRERRRLPEYSRKSDPKLTESTLAELEVQSPGAAGNDAPLDMSIRQRGLPPSYSQAISSSGYRPTVITQAPNLDSTPPGTSISMCDLIIDEHFRRSLGKDYLMLFNNKTPTVPPPSQPPMTAVAKRDFLMDMDSAGLSVDDHFAKALGDTWHKLNQKDTETTSPGAVDDKITVVSL